MSLMIEVEMEARASLREVVSSVLTSVVSSRTWQGYEGVITR